MCRCDDSVNCDRDYGKVCLRGAPGRDVVLIARHRSRHLRRRRSQQLAYIAAPRVRARVLDAWRVLAPIDYPSRVERVWIGRRFLEIHV